MSEKSLMKLASDLGVSFSAAKIISDHVRIEYDAKITKADKLCEAVSSLSEGYWGFANLHFVARLKKAIAEYEGKE
jgi:hypothetical protein